MEVATRPTPTSRPAARFVRPAVVPVGVGIGLGLLSFASDYLLRYPWSAIGNVIGTWIVASFAVGALSGAGSLVRAGGSGAVALLGATATYYVSTSTMWPASDVRRLLPAVIVWAAVSVIAGPAGGVAGGIWREGDSRSRWPIRPIAVAALAAVLGAEAIFLAIGAPDADYRVSGIELLVAVALPIVLLGSRRDRLAAYLGLAILIAVGVPLMAVSLPWLFRLAGSGW